MCEFTLPVSVTLIYSAYSILIVSAHCGRPSNNGIPDDTHLPHIPATTLDHFTVTRLEDHIFVDKSLLIKELLPLEKAISITQRRLMGKSFNLIMLKKFFEIEIDDKGNQLPADMRLNRKLFAGGQIHTSINGAAVSKLLRPLKISKHTDIMSRYQGQFPVVLLNLTLVTGHNYQTVREAIICQIHATFTRFAYLRHSTFLNSAQKRRLETYLSGSIDGVDVPDSLNFLSQLLHTHFKQKVFVLIDAYDAPINHARAKFGNTTDEDAIYLSDHDRIHYLVQGLLCAALKFNPHLEQGIMCGTLRIVLAEPAIGGLNNVRHYSILEANFTEYYGFTQDEFDTLVAKIPSHTHPSSIMSWYNSYNLGDHVLYCPLSIAQCLSRGGELGYFWPPNDDTPIPDAMFNPEQLHDALRAFLEGEHIFDIALGQTRYENEYAYRIHNLLVFTGYVNFVPDFYNLQNRRILLTPNDEMKGIYVSKMIQWVTDELNISTNEYHALLALLRAGKIDRFEEKLQQYLHTIQERSYFDPRRGEYHLILVGEMVSSLALEYSITSHNQWDYSRGGYVLVPLPEKHTDLAILIECKVVTMAKNLLSIANLGLHEINNVKHDEQVKSYCPHVRSIVKVSMAFCGKQVAVAYQTDSIQ